MHLWWKMVGREGWRVGGEEEDVCGWRDQSDFCSASPSIHHFYGLCTRLRMKVGKAPGAGRGYTDALLLAFVFSDSLYLRARPLSI